MYVQLIRSLSCERVASFTVIFASPVREKDCFIVMGNFQTFWPSSSFHFQILVIAVTLALASVGAVGLSKLKVDFNPLWYLREDSYQRSFLVT